MKYEGSAVLAVEVENGETVDAQIPCNEERGRLHEDMIVTDYEQMQMLYSFLLFLWEKEKKMRERKKRNSLFLRMIEMQWK